MAIPQPSYRDQIPIQGIPLTQFTENHRAMYLDRMESYYRTTQDNNKTYDWDGNYLTGMPGQLPVPVSGRMPNMASRKPCTRYDLARVIVKRLTSFMFGSGFPEIKVEGDQDAEDYVKALCEAARLPQRLAAARDLAGATGTVCFSSGFVQGKPRVEVHNAKHCTVLRWMDRSELGVSAALKAYRYHELVQDGDKLERRAYWFVRYWDEEREIQWEPIPQEVAERPNWSSWRHITLEHGAGFCPFYWVQNQPNGEDEDGESDYEGLCDLFDENNRLLSATTKGTRANVDPTLVIHADPSMNPGSIRTGSDNTIFNEKGAAFLELNGGSQQAAERQAIMLKQMALDSAGVVLADPETLTGAAQSAAALRLLYAPMLAKADTLREQFGEYAIKPVLLGLLRMAKRVNEMEPFEEMQPDGTMKLVKPRVILPPKVTQDEGEEPKIEDRVPGESEDIDIKWQPYFPPTWTDINTAVLAAKAASGDKPLVSQRTAIASIAQLFQISNVDAEQKRIRDDEEHNAGMAMAMLDAEVGAKAGITTEERGLMDGKKEEEE